MLINQYLVPVGMPTGTNTVVVLSALDVVFRIFHTLFIKRKVTNFFCIQKIFFQQNEKREKESFSL